MYNQPLANWGATPCGFKGEVFVPYLRGGHTEDRRIRTKRISLRPNQSPGFSPRESLRNELWCQACVSVGKHSPLPNHIAALCRFLLKTRLVQGGTSPQPPHRASHASKADPQFGPQSRAVTPTKAFFMRDYHRLTSYGCGIASNQW